MSSINYCKLQYLNVETKVENLKSSLEAYGVASIPGVLHALEIEEALSLRNDYLARAFKKKEHNVDMLDEDTWRNIVFRHGAKHGGLLQHYGAGASEFAWFVRQREGVIRPFSTLWKTDDLCVSFDGVNVTAPPEITNLGWQNPKEGWLHMDQGSKKIGFAAAQGLVNLIDVDEGDATLAVILGSHLFHEAFFKAFGFSCNGDWVKLSASQIDWFLRQEYAPGKRCELVAIKARAGDLILWDSRTVHMGLTPSRGRVHSYRFRSVVYVCYRPRSTFTKRELERRKKYVENGDTTNHWGTVKFAPKPWRRGHVEDEPEPREYQQVELGPIGLSLI